MEDRSGFSVMEARKLGESLESHGLIGWHYEQLRKVPFLKSEIRGQLNRGAIFPTNPRLKDELKKLSDNVQDAIEKAIDKAVDYVNNASTQNGIELSDKGKDFVAVCMPDIDVEFVNQHVNETTNTEGEIASTGPKGDV